MNQDYNCVDVKISRWLGVLSQCSRHDATILHFTRFRIPLNAALSPECTWLLTWQSLLTPGVNGSPWQCLFWAESRIGVNKLTTVILVLSQKIRRKKKFSELSKAHIKWELVAEFQWLISKANVWIDKSFNTTVKQPLFKI